MLLGGIQDGSLVFVVVFLFCSQILCECSDVEVMPLEIDLLDQFVGLSA